MSKAKSHLSFLIMVVASLFLAVPATAQTNDSLQSQNAEELIANDSELESDTVENRVKKATLLALIPGAGQIYNGKYWKLPIVYGALAATIYAADFNHDQYRIYYEGFKSRRDEDPNNNQFVGVYNDRQLIELQNQYRKWRDLSLILTAAAYGLQIIDAHVDAHLRTYDVSDDLTLRWDPAVIQSDFNLHPQAFGLGITLSLK